MNEIRIIYKQHKKTLLIVVVVVVLSLALAMQSRQESEDTRLTVTRSQEGGGSSVQTFSYETKDGTEDQVSVNVNATERTAEEAEKLLDQAAAQWKKQCLDGNDSVNEVRSDLDFEKSYCDGLVTASFESDNYDVMDQNGALGEDLPEEGSLVTITAQFTYGDYEQSVTQAFQVFPPKEGTGAWIRQKVNDAVETAEETTRTEATFELPVSVEGYQIQWEKEADKSWMMILLLGLLAAFCLEFREKEQVRKQEKLRKERLTEEYPLMVEQMALLIGSGMTIRRAWERILSMDLRRREQSGEPERFFLKEMRITYREIQQGVGEREAYQRFGSRIGLLPYRRFSSLLSQNLTKGTRDLQDLLDRESREAQELRKNNARQKGEEAGTKLLFPMLLLFVLILVVLLYPALLHFNL